MTDIATLGLRIDATDVARASAALDRFTSKAGGTQQAAAQMARVLGTGSPQVRQFTQAFGALNSIQSLLPASANQVVGALTNQITKANVSARTWAQLTAIQQAGVPIGSQAANAIGQMAGAAFNLSQKAQQAHGSTSNFFSHLQNRLVGASAAILILHRVAGGLEEIAKQLPGAVDLAGRLGLSFTKFQALEDVAQRAGVDTKTLQESMLKFGLATSQARDRMGSLGELLVANGRQAGTFEQNMSAVADLVKNARREIDKFAVLTAAGLPATREMVALFEQGGTALKAQVEEAEKHVALTEAQGRQAKELEKQFNALWADMEHFGRRAVLAIANDFDEFVESQRPNLDKIKGWWSSLVTFINQNRPTVVIPAIENAPKTGFGGVPFAERFRPAEQQPFGALTRPGAATPAPGTTRPTVLPEVEKNDIARAQALIGLMGELATVEDKVAAKRRELRLATLNQIDVDGRLAARIIDLTRLQAEQVIGAARETLGIASAQEVRANRERELNIAVRTNILTQQEADRLMANSNRLIQDRIDNLTVMNSKFPDLARFAVDAGRLDKQLDQLAVNGINAASTAMVDFATGSKTAGEAFKEFSNTVLRAVLEMVIRMTILAPIAKSLQTSLGGFLPGGTGGVTVPAQHSGGLLGSGYPIGRSVDPRVFLGAPRMHSGGGLRAGEVPFIGMRGEEVGWPAQLAAKYGGGGGGDVSVVVNNYGGAQVDARTRARPGGGVDLEITVDKAVARNLVTPGRDTNAALNRANTLVRR